MLLQLFAGWEERVETTQRVEKKRKKTCSILTSLPQVTWTREEAERERELYSSNVYVSYFLAFLSEVLQKSREVPGCLPSSFLKRRRAGSESVPSLSAFSHSSMLSLTRSLFAVPCIEAGEEGGEEREEKTDEGKQSTGNVLPRSEGRMRKLDQGVMLVHMFWHFETYFPVSS